MVAGVASSKSTKNYNIIKAKKISKKHKRKAIVTIILDSDEEPENQYECEHCKKKFATYRALGGHNSRKHPGMS